jgi:hypothetical protein
LIEFIELIGKKMEGERVRKRLKRRGGESEKRREEPAFQLQSFQAFRP